MSELTPIESSELRSLEARVGIALQAASAGQPPAPESLCELLVDALSQLKMLASGSLDRPSAVESIERALAALEAWRRWRPPASPSA